MPAIPPVSHTPDRIASRARWLFLLILMVYVALAVRLIHLQYLQHGVYVQERQRQLSAYSRYRPWRGTITDNAGRVLALSKPGRSCALDPLRLQQAGAGVTQVVTALSKYIDLSPRDVQRLHERAQRQGCRFVWVQRHLDDSTYQRLREQDLPGVFFPKEYQRTYPQHQLAAHLLGMAGIDGQGQEAIELVCDAYLAGSATARPAQRDARGRLLVTNASQGTDERLGLGVQLTLDSTIQMIAEEELQKAVDKYRGPQTKACAVVMDPYTGDILAMANVPTFDPNDPTGTPTENRLNLAIASVIEPGSTFKPFVLAAALQEKRVRLDDRFHCENGAWRMANGRVLHDAHGYGWLTAAKVIIKSSNIGIAKIAARLGPRLLHRYVEAFGFGEPSGVALPGELPATVHPLAQWTSYSMGSVPMGQEITVTPLQLATAYCALANGGVLMRPRVVKALRCSDGAVADAFPPRARRQVIDPAVATAMRRVLGRVVQEGTGKRARIPEYALGGKTGTSQLPVNAAEYQAGLRGYSDNRYVASFVAIAPYDVPRIVVLVSVREPHGSHYGGVVAAPAVREISRRALLYLKVPPQSSMTAGR